MNGKCVVEGFAVAINAIGYCCCSGLDAPVRLSYLHLTFLSPLTTRFHTHNYGVAQSSRLADQG